MAIKSTKKVLASILSLAVFSQSFCGAIKNFMENKDDPRKSIVIKKEKPTGFDKIKEFAKKHPVKAAVGGVVGLGTVIIVGGIIVKNAFFDDQNYQNDQNDQNDQENILTAEDVEEGNLNKFSLTVNGVLTIKEGITAIGPYAFANREDLKEVKISNSVTIIGDYAFWGCVSLGKVTIPNSVTTIGVDAFNGCTNLKEVNFEENSQLKEIGGGAFFHCGLTEVTIPNSVTTIGGYAFCGCTNLKEVNFEEKSQLKEIGENAFWNTSLNLVTIPKNCEYVKKGSYLPSFPDSCKVIIRKALLKTNRKTSL